MRDRADSERRSMRGRGRGSTAKLLEMHRDSIHLEPWSHPSIPGWFSSAVAIQTTYREARRDWPIMEIYDGTGEYFGARNDSDV